MEYELYHYGVKGMKWGVRKEARLLRKARLHDYKSHTARTQYLRDWHAGKAQRLTRNADIIAKQRFANDERRSKEDREAWQKEANKAKTERFLEVLATSPATDGRIKRYKLKGDSEVKATIKAYGVQSLYNMQATLVGAAGIASLALLLG